MIHSTAIIDKKSKISEHAEKLSVMSSLNAAEESQIVILMIDSERGFEKQDANIAIEEKRANKEIGSSLEAEIKLILKKDKFELLDKLDLEDYFIVSKAEKELSNNDDIKIEVKKAQGQKCERCWKILEKKCQRETCPIK